ncbi:MAG TPA: hypothetical protein VLA04_06745 [Verrucomicrobiae bacterium]|nr:hypothetical protein [Verrucomicrobiae bacterium]
MPSESPAVWLTGLVLGAARALPIAEKQRVAGYISTPKGAAYQVLQPLGNAEHYNLHGCLLPGDSEQIGVLKIAATTKDNDSLDREAMILKMMREKAEEAERHASRGGGVRLNYHYFFPQVVDSFICPEQDERRINILGFPPVIETLSQLSPLTALRQEGIRADPRTGAWIIGKTLKVLAFAHGQGISNRNITASNILIEREQHGVVIFDWTRSKLASPTETNAPEESEDLRSLGRLATSILGGDLKTGELPKDDQLTDERFQKLIRDLAQGKFSSAISAYTRFYELIYTLWPREFHPFMAYSLEPDPQEKINAR